MGDFTCPISRNQLLDLSPIAYIIDSLFPDKQHSSSFQFDILPHKLIVLDTLSNGKKLSCCGTQMVIVTEALMDSVKYPFHIIEAHLEEFTFSFVHYPPDT